MKNKILVLLGTFIFCMTLGLKDAMAASATDVACKAPCINSFEIQDGQVTSSDIADGAVTNTKISDGAVTETKINNSSVTNTKIGDGAVTEPKLSTGAVTNGKISDSAVTNTKIQDGAVTDAKITGPITASKIQQGSGSGLNADLLDGMDSSAFSKKPANVIVVAQSGGDFTSIQAAIDSINPTEDNPYLIKVMPGTYVENITMKSYIHLMGAGADVTTIQSPSISTPTLNVNSLTKVAITDFTITTVQGGYHYGIFLRSASSITISGNTIKGNGWGIVNYGSSPKIIGNTINNNVDSGVYNDHAMPTIKDNIITENGLGIWNDSSSSGTIIENTIQNNGAGGIKTEYSSSPIITGNTITGNGKPINGYGIYISTSASPTISGNIITNNYRGISIDSGATLHVTNNRITGNGSFDIYVYNSSTPNISFNVYDTIQGATGVGMYNVKSDGTPATEP